MTLAGCARASAGLIRARPLASIGLGAAVMLSLGGLCCGLGLLAAPLCATQLYRVQLGVLRGPGLDRQVRAPLAAAGVWLVAALLVLLSALLGLVAGGGAAAPMAGPVPDSLPAVSARAAAFGVLSGLSALLFNLPAMYAPLLLLEGRTGAFEALLESARRVLAGGGAKRELGVALLAHGLPALPPLVSGVCAAGLRDVLWWGLAGSPFVAVALAAGHGIIAAAYVSERGAPAAGLASAPPAPRAVRVLWTGLWLAPVLSAALLALTLLAPARLAPGALRHDGGWTVYPGSDGERHRVTPAGSSVAVDVSRGGVKVTMRDGGGAGRLPLRHRRQPVERVRVVGLSGHYGVEVWQGDAVTHALIDPMGVRLDDTLAARLLSRVPGGVCVSLLGVQLCLAAGLLWALASLGGVRIRQGPCGEAGQGSTGAGRKQGFERGPWASPAGRRATRRALRAGLGLAPLAAWELSWAIYAIG